MTDTVFSTTSDYYNTNESCEIIKQPKRLVNLDYIRGLGIMILIFIHGIVYHYGLLDELDLNNLNPLFMIIYVVLNWAGLFALISGVVNTYSSFYRLKNNEKEGLSYPAWKAFGKRWLFLGFFFLCLNVIYNFLLSPFVYNFETKTASYSLLAGIIRTREWYQVSAEKIIQGSVFAMLGWNLILLGLFFSLLFKGGSEKRKKSKKLVLLILGVVIVVISFIRIWFFDDFFTALENGNYGLAFLIDIFAGEYFPLLPYLGYGLIGAYFGLFLAENPSRINIRRHIWIVLSFVAASVIAFFIPDGFYMKNGLLDNIFSSYIVILFGIGFFISVGIIVFLIKFRKKNNDTEFDKNKKIKSPKIILIFSKNSLTFFLLERPAAEIFAAILQLIKPGWNNYIWSCLLFGGFLVLFWMLVAIVWNKVNLKFSFEWWLVKMFRKINYKSNKSF